MYVFLRSASSNWIRFSTSVASCTFCSHPRICSRMPASRSSTPCGRSRRASPCSSASRRGCSADLVTNWCLSSCTCCWSAVVRFTSSLSCSLNCFQTSSSSSDSAPYFDSMVSMLIEWTSTLERSASRSVRSALISCWNSAFRWLLAASSVASAVACADWRMVCPRSWVLRVAASCKPCTCSVSALSSSSRICSMQAFEASTWDWCWSFRDLTSACSWSMTLHVSVSRSDRSLTAVHCCAWTRSRLSILSKRLSKLFDKSLWMAWTSPACSACASPSDCMSSTLRFSIFFSMRPAPGAFAAAFRPSICAWRSRCSMRSRRISAIAPSIAFLSFSMFSWMRSANCFMFSFMAQRRPWTSMAEATPHCCSNPAGGCIGIFCADLLRLEWPPDDIGAGDVPVDGTRTSDTHDAVELELGKLRLDRWLWLPPFA
mmetsp:Transcript_110183/g.311844  ORF Transcript_110183/g.311844 Transcript_110183/m.311844 type:complete len:430 (-) Transcript_110183:57-1346(-)